MVAALLLGALVGALIAVARALPGRHNGTIFVHVGPAKTGSTFVQNEIAARKNELLAQGVCWPGPPIGKAFLRLNEALQHHGDVSPWSREIDGCLREGHDVIISSEHLFHNRNLLPVIKFLYPYRGRVKIIVMYRELFSRKASVYSQTNKERVDTMSFGEFVLQDSSSEAAAQQICFQDSCAINTTQRLQRVFGPENLVFIDYDGAAAANQNLAEVLMCQVVGALCGASWPVEKANSSPRMLPHQLLRIISDAARVLGCRLCIDRTGVTPSELASFIDSELDLTPTVKFPTVTTDLAQLRTVSEQASLEWRRLFGDRMLYNNHTAAMQVRDALVMEELDERAFFQSVECTAWLRKQLAALLTRKQLCGCSSSGTAAIGAMV